MIVENLMYFALGFLGAGLLALMIMPSIWNRAVRLTKRRIEAATPMTMSEFRADKDQLRAEFAVTSRRLEMVIEQLRARIATHLAELDRKKTELAEMRAERDEQLSISRELADRGQAHGVRMQAIETELARLQAELRQREEDVAALQAIQEETASGRDPIQLSGDYRRDVEDLILTLGIERQRGDFLEEQTRLFSERVDGEPRQSDVARKAAADLRAVLDANKQAFSPQGARLSEAEAHMAKAESSLSALLEETRDLVAGGDPEPATERPLAEALFLADGLDALRRKVDDVERRVMEDWQSERATPEELREHLAEIASDVSRLLYEEHAEAPEDESETLFDRVRKFAPDSADVHQLPATNRNQPVPAGNLSERMNALRDIRAR